MVKFNIGNGTVWFSFDDFHQDNIKIANLLDKYGLKATFFIETIQKEARDQIEILHKMGHEIGAHTIHHVSDLKLLNSVECMSEIEGSKKMIEAITNTPCVSFCYPRGRFNDDVISKVKLSGFEDARTTHVLHTRSEDPYKMPTTVHIYPNRKEYNGRSYMALFNFYLEDVLKNGGTLSIWGHAFELNNFSLWEDLESIVSKIAEYKK